MARSLTSGKRPAAFSRSGAADPIPRVLGLAEEQDRGAIAVHK
jgi:hypothetical protein